CTASRRSDGGRRGHHAPPPAWPRPAPRRLDAGEASVWGGPTVASGDVQDPSLCGTAAGSCQTYTIRLNQPGARLRVALDTPMRSNTFQFDVIDPAGHTAASATNSNAFDAEAFALAPKPGTWKVLVMPPGGSNASARLPRQPG